MKKAGLLTFDAWAHHPYYAHPVARRRAKPPTGPNGGAGRPRSRSATSNTLIKLVTPLYGNKRIWITEYGYQTNPPDKIVRRPVAKQALYLTQAFAIAKANPRIQLMLWFLLKDEPNLNGWQSGLITYGGARSRRSRRSSRWPRGRVAGGRQPSTRAARGRARRCRR